MVRTRFAPSPTGVLHLGSVRTALFCWLYAHHCNGQFILRIEDTDRARSTRENVDAITDGLKWLRLHADEGPIFQSDRMDRYREVIAQWLDHGLAYHCYCSRDELEQMRLHQAARGEKARYDGRCRNRRDVPEGIPPVVRFKNPTDGEVIVDDIVRGKVVFQNAELDDLIIARSDGSPTYNFTVVVDDADMNISHVVRGDDHLNNTPRQMNMIAAMGHQVPKYAHLPMILGSDGAKLSKRHGAVDIREYRERGYLPQAILNYLVRLGWSHGDQEVFSLDEMIRKFDLVDVNASASAFNPEKLEWLNQQYIIDSDAQTLGSALRPFLEREGLDIKSGPDPARVANAFRERATTLLHMAQSCRYCYEDFDEIEVKAAKKFLRPVIERPMSDFRDRLAALAQWDEVALTSELRDCAARHDMNLGKLGQPVRVAVTGGSVSPPIDVTLALIGRDRVIERLDRALALIRERGEQTAGKNG